MILQSLVKYYENLVKNGKAVSPGWEISKVSYVIQLKKDGSIQNIVCLKSEVKRGEKKVLVPPEMQVPKMVNRSSNIAANFLCDNAKFLLGIDKEELNSDEKKRAKAKDNAKKRFEASKKLHLTYLEDVHTEIAEAVKNFFRNWNPDVAAEHPEVKENWKGLTESGYIVFCMGLNYAQDDEKIRQKWNQIENANNEGEPEEICLVTGKTAPIARLHKKIKGIKGAQASGAALISFDKEAFTSDGRKQGYNAPVSTYAEFAYTTAINYLLSNNYYTIIEDTTILYWSENDKDSYQDDFAAMITPVFNNQDKIQHIMNRRLVTAIKEPDMDPDENFYILGLKPNASRLGVSFFYTNTFGNILNNIIKHYERMQQNTNRNFRIKEIIEETGIQEKRYFEYIAEKLFHAIVTDTDYPKVLAYEIMNRICLEQGNVNNCRIAFLKAYLIKNKGLLKETDFTSLTETDNTAYNLGRIYCILSKIKSDARNSNFICENFTMASKYPFRIFPKLFDLNIEYYLENLTIASKIYYENLLMELMGKINEEQAISPLNPEEQMLFTLGFHHQKTYFFTKKEKREKQQKKQQKPFALGLTETDNTAYNLGRIYCILSKIKSDARNDDFICQNYIMAINCPYHAFSRLFKSNDYYLNQLPIASKIYYENLLTEVKDKINKDLSMKPLNPEEHMLFTLGFYHQKAYFFTPKENSEKKQNSATVEAEE